MADLEPLLHNVLLDSGVYRPLFFRLPADEAALSELLKTTPGISVHDQLEHQLKELVKGLDPRKRPSPGALEEAMSKRLGGRSLLHYGVWVFYPWSKRLVHLLDADDFAQLRTDRNRNKITRDEQAVLSSKTIGVIGLSVGQSVSLTMALERTFGEIRLADFDTLDLSNLNRIRSGTHSLGLNKAIITAREIAEIDPFLEVVCFTDGLTVENMDAFFTEGGPLDLLVEECDSVDIKILARQKAKAMGIPVVMDMSDRGCLDVERFDLEPDRPIMHGWIDHLDLEAAKRPMTAEEKVPYMLPITGVDTLSPRMKASLVELGQTLSTWPQLATSVALGGALAGDVVRRIFLDEFHGSGRWFVDLDELIGDKADTSATKEETGDSPTPLRLDKALLDKLGQRLGPAHKDALALDRDAVAGLVEAGGLAPSSGNMQPWKFAWRDKRLFLFHDRDRSHSFWDPDHFIAHIGLGACVENIILKAQSMGFEVKCSVGPVKEEEALTAVFEFHRQPMAGVEPRVADDLAPLIGTRCTNRRFPQPGPLPAGAADRLAEMALSGPGSQLHLVEDRETLMKLADLCGAAERIRILNPIGHKEFFGHEVRWTPEDAQRTRDGLDLATMEMRPADLAGLQVAADPRTISLVNRWKGGKGLENVSAPAIRASSAAMLVSIGTDSLQGRIDASRLFQRLWMTANSLGLAVHPIAAPILLTHGLSLIRQQLLPAESRELDEIRQGMDTVLGLNGRMPIFMVRLALAGEPSMRSLRLSLPEIMPDLN